MPALDEMLAFLDARQASATAAAVATIRTGGNSGWAVGERLLWDSAGGQGGALQRSSLEPVLAAPLTQVLEARKSRLLHLPDADVFLEWIGPPQSLVVLGAGHDTIPLAAMAQTLGWDVAIFDGRPAYRETGPLPRPRAGRFDPGLRR